MVPVYIVVAVLVGVAESVKSVIRRGQPVKTADSASSTFANIKDMPMVGYGTMGSSEQSMAWYLEHGGRLLDTAHGYGNHVSVGKVLKQSGLAPGAVWITSKLNHDQMGRDNATKAIDKALTELDVKTIDMMLIHHPAHDTATRVATWQALVDAQKQGKVRHIGVSNFGVDQVKELINATGVTPANDQFEISPYAWHKPNNDPVGKRVAALQELGITVTAYGLFGHMTAKEKKITKAQKLDTDLAPLRSKYKKTANQILLRWALDRGIYVIPGGTSEEHIKENLDVHDFHLTEEDLSYMESLKAPEEFAMWR